MHIVKYTESERGWGGEVWYKGFNIKQAAEVAVYENNKSNPKDHVPDWYILAEYIGERDEVPKGYKF